MKLKKKKDKASKTPPDNESNLMYVNKTGSISENKAVRDSVDFDLQHLVDENCCIDEHTKCKMVNLHPTMLGISPPFTMVMGTDGPKAVQYNLLDCNYNVSNSNKGSEIMNNIPDNATNIKASHK